MENPVNIRETSTATVPPVVPKKKVPIQVIFGVVAFVLLVLGGGVSFFLSQQSQDIRQQAASNYQACVDQCNLIPSTDAKAACLAGCSATASNPPVVSPSPSPSSSTCPAGQVPVYSNGIQIGCSATCNSATQCCQQGGCTRYVR